MSNSIEHRAALKIWRDGLVGLTRQSALIKFKAPKSSSLLFDSPGPDELLSLLRSGKSQTIRGDIEFDAPSSPRPLANGTAFHSPRPDGEVGAVVRNLMRKGNTEFLDRGLAVLYVTFGILDWRDVDGTEMVSPLLLVPIQLIPEGPRSTPRITEGEDDAVLNPALALRLKEFGIELPTPEDLDGLSVTDTMSAVRAALGKVDTFKDWTLRDAVHLGTFSFAKEAMFKDLSDNEEKILAHPIVRALATSDPSTQSPEFQFDPIDPADIDRLAPPEVNPLVLDADSSQRAAVAAALDGRTFVMDGPPGTGKSQTIANMIGALLHSGKSVLFVSEKMAALDVVRNRLAAAGLGSYLLELHSHKAKRKEVATELLTTLDNVPRPPAAMPSITRQGAKERREQLNDYAAAMNEIRQPLNMSLHTALGHYGNLSDAPVAPVPETAPTSLSEAEYLAIQETLVKIARAWRPAAQGKSFLWREVEDDQSLEVRLYQAESALEELRGTVALNVGVADAFGLHKPSDTTTIVALVAHQHSGGAGDVLESWLTSPSTEAFAEARRELGEQIASLKEAEDVVAREAGVPWTALPDPAALPVAPMRVDVTPLPVDLTAHRAAELREAAERFEAQVALLRERQSSLNKLATTIGLPPIQGLPDVDRLGRLVDLRSRDVRPERRWFTHAGLVDARAAARVLREHLEALEAAEQRASALFTPDALKAPLVDLQNRFTNLHKGLKKLSGNYRTDKKTVAALLTDASNVKTGIANLSDALAWSEASQGLDKAAATWAESLGQHWRGRDTDFDALARAFTATEDALAMTDNDPPGALVSYLAGTDDNSGPQAVMDSARADIVDWKNTLGAAPALSGRTELLIEPIATSIAWLEAHVTPMRLVANRLAAVNTITGNDYTLNEAEHLLELTSNARRADAAMGAAADGYRAAFGHHFAVGDTDLERLDNALAWAAELRALAGDALTPEQIKALADSNVVEAATPAHEKWTQARDRIVGAFGASRHEELLTEFDDYRDAVDLIEAFRADTVGHQEWFEYRRAYTTLADLGLDTAIDFCIEQRLSESQVPDVAKKALLRAWSDGVVQGDERLRPLLAVDREALVEEYRNLDRSLIHAATADIITATNTRRPANTSMGESAVIRREGAKQRKHKPVRDLMAATRTVTPSIKPVFMMSPLAVSQYLPSDMEFDVVIFDEASQVTPGDAINCIYRGKALILAGDDKQLPPTSFFERNTDEDDEEETDVKDFQSVLELAKACGAFNNLGLRWHYRSRHEDLIGFSNYKFYEGKLVTFPSAHAEGEDVGVEFFHVDGTYRRGGGAFNPIEAAKVADRVIEHYTNRPDLTLGVVTFSVAQADAVQAAIDEARLARRDLDRYFDTEDRLDGFFIRALEQVQGDERDVIIFSVGYGPDEAGKISTNFGALNKDKGWRRLNVGITRARQRVEVVASMRAGQIPPSTNENVEYFRAYLDYAERGQQVLAIPYSSTGLDPDSPFEESVITTLRNWGYVVEPQVGAAGFRIDIGIRHPAYPGMFALGVECDGYQYHSAPAARDRDRLRDQILTGLGWRLHRIWGTAWYRDRTTEEKRLRVAVEAAISAPIHNRTKKIADIERPVVETEVAEVVTAPTWTNEYRLAIRKSLPRWADPGESGNHLHMIEPIEHLVAHEGPIHLDVAYERLRDWWGVGRIGSNIRTNITLAIQRSEIVQEGDFLVKPGSSVDQVRTPTPAASRKVEQVHLDELATAVVMTLRDAGAASRTEVTQSVARLFGWTRTGAIVEHRIGSAIDRAVAAGDVTADAGMLTARRV